MYSTNQPSNLSGASIETIALSVRARASEAQASGTRPMLESLTQSYGGKIELAEHSVGASGSLVVRKPEDFTVYLSPYTSPLRDNFTIAHELGHYVLHYVFPQRTDEAVFQRHGIGPLETEANRFAAALLMPASEFKQARDEGLNEFALAGRFGVSPEAAKVRMSYV